MVLVGDIRASSARPARSSRPRDRAPVSWAGFATHFADWPEAVARVTDELDTLLDFPDYPVEHHIHMRTTNPIESTFATVLLRTRVTKGAGFRAAGLAMAFKLVDAAQARWRRTNAPSSSPSSGPVPGPSTVSYRNGVRHCPRTSPPSPRSPPPDQ